VICNSGGMIGDILHILDDWKAIQWQQPGPVGALDGPISKSLNLSFGRAPSTVSRKYPTYASTVGRETAQAEFRCDPDQEGTMQFLIAMAPKQADP